MANRRNDGWEANSEVYSEEQVEGVLTQCGVEVVSDTFTHFLAFCPFHGNSDTPALAVDKTQGLFTCFNPSCQKSGKLIDLVKALLTNNHFQALRIIAKNADNNVRPFSERMQEALNKPPMFTQFPVEPVSRMASELAGSPGEAYMLSRHFKKETLECFEIGYSYKQDMVTVPMHAPDGMLVGFVGRKASHEDKVFKNSNALPKSLVPWNFHRAKRKGSTVIVVEASFDAMRVHQAGHECVVALLGGSLSQYHIDLLSRTFSTVIIMTDFDLKKIHYPNCRRCKINNEICTGHRPGRDLGAAIATRVPTNILWATYDDVTVFPLHAEPGYRDGAAKDVGDMTDEEIRQCIRNASSRLNYELRGYERKFDSLLAS